MSRPTPRSQAGQDRFAFAVTGEREAGTFLDIGSGDPVIFNNSCMLEEIGWRGLSVDRGAGKAGPAFRTSQFLRADALTVDWPLALAAHGLGPRIDYLSFDLDEDGAIALMRLPWTTVRFSCMTVEHDCYRFGERPRTVMRELLLGHGYRLLCPDVMLDGYGSFEDWWVDPGHVDEGVADRFATHRPTHWLDILDKGDALMKQRRGSVSAGPKVCLSMIVKNERAVIERCLTAALPFIDEWVIADTGSTDGTGDVIERFFAGHGLPGTLVRTTFRDFAQARNESLAAARAFGAWDYALAIDADMEIRGSLDREALTGSAYQIEQRTGALSYWNTRLVRRDAAAQYVGVTHEFLSVPGGRPPRLDSIVIDDRNDGGSRGDKSERDIRLLNEGLSKEPNNDRYMFYLANTYREAGRHAEAIQWYLRRIAVGGWDEEVWSSYYGIAQSRAAMNDEPGLALACFDAYNYRPTRAEPLSFLARWWREHGKNDASLLLAEVVARVADYPTDILFIEKNAYERKNAIDVSIAGFYSKVPARRQAGYAACAKLTLDLDGAVRNEARNNFNHYVRSAVDLFGARLEKIPWQSDVVYAPATPSVLVLPTGRRLVSVRTVNYVITDECAFPTVDGQPIHTKNWIVEMDESWQIARRLPVVDETGLPRSGGPVRGFEDLRLYLGSDGTLRASSTVLDLGDGRCELAILALEECLDRWAIRSARIVRDYEHDKHQKNWMPILGFPDRFVYYCDPTTVIEAAPGGTIEWLRTADLAHNLTEFRGGSQLIPYQDGWLCVIHEVIFIESAPKRLYLHRFVQFTAAFAIEAVSDPFYLERKGIEVVAGLARDGDRIVASYSVRDAQVSLAFFDLAAVGRALHRLEDRK
jgi:glycosyltransferase involved in cell wall biosynthesis